MIIVCSGDTRLIKLCSDLAAQLNDTVRQEEFKHVELQKLSANDALIIDLKEVDERNITGVESPAVALAAIPLYEQAMKLLQKGIRGYGNRFMLPENLIQAVTAVKAEQVWLPPDILNQMITTLPGTSSPAKIILRDPLSKREEEVVQCVVIGLSNKEIAEKLFISLRTVKAHLTSIFKKTECRDRLELALKMKQS